MRISVSVIDVVAAENIWNILQLRETTLAALILNKLKINLFNKNTSQFIILTSLMCTFLSE